MSEGAEAVKNETGPVISAEGQVLAYSSLYLMAIFCIYLGSLRSVVFVRKHKVTSLSQSPASHPR